MAKKSSTTPGSFTPNTSSSTETRRFDEGLEKNFDDYHLKDSQWTYARNAINNSNLGDLGKLGNEPANLLCITVPAGYTIIGHIHIESDKYAIFSTDDTNSEIGYFEEDLCRYTKIVNDVCLNFKRSNLIYGVSRETSECNHVLYWDDGLNPSRVLNISDIKFAPYPEPWPNVPWVCVDVDTGPCIDCQPIGPPYVLDCDKIRLAPLMDPLCLRVQKSWAGGNLLNGAYFVVGAYTVKGERMTDYFPPSNQQPIFNHLGSGGSIMIYVDSADTSFFDEFELVVISVIGQQTVAKKVGIYSTRTQQITLDIIDNSLATVPIEEIPIRTSVYYKSDAMYTANDYLMRVGPTSKLDFNYQPLANLIRTKWQAVEYNADYYIKGGNKTGYMRDEVYSFFIRFVYDTGDRSPSYHIPGRPSFSTVIQNPGLTAFLETDIAPSNDDNWETYTSDIACGVPRVWEVYNTARSLPPIITPPQYVDDEYLDCAIPPGRIIEEGYMGYWQSSEIYPDNKPDVWNSPTVSPLPYPNTTASQYDLCGTNIRHHRFPDNDFSFYSTIFDTTAAGSNPVREQKIRIMAVKFENIQPPRIDPFDPNSPLVPGVKCFEILRGSRKGNRTVIAKGIINNMVLYDIPDEISVKKGLFQNYPYNDVRGDEFLSVYKTRYQSFSSDYGYYSQKTGKTVSGAGGTYSYGPNFIDEWGQNLGERYSRQIFSFHSPETNFDKPFLGVKELKVYQELDGGANHYYQYVSGHPRHKMMTDLAFLLAGIAGLGAGVFATMGKFVREYDADMDYTLYDLPGANIFFAYYGLGVPNLQGISGSAGADYPINSGSNDRTTVENTPATSAWVMNFLFQQIAGGASPIFSYYWTEGAEATYRLLTNAVPWQQYALQQLSHCFYDNSISTRYSGAFGGLNPRAAGQRRRFMSDISYVDGHIQDFDNDKRINNLYRSNFVALKATRPLNYPVIDDYTRKDTSLKGLITNNPPASAGGPNPGTPGGLSSPAMVPWGSNAPIFLYPLYAYLYRNPQTTFQRDSSTYYAAIKQRLRNQYGQLNNISQIPITPCPNCCIGQAGTQQLVTDGSFDNELADWDTGLWQVYNGNVTGSQNCPNDPPAAQIQVPNSLINTNYLSQDITWVAGQEYTFCVCIQQLPPGFQINVSFCSTCPGWNLTISQSGEFCTQVIAEANWDQVLFNAEDVNPPCINTWPEPERCWKALPPAAPWEQHQLDRLIKSTGGGAQVYEFSSGCLLTKTIDLRLRGIPSGAGAWPFNGQNIGNTTNNPSNDIFLSPIGGNNDPGYVENRRTRTIWDLPAYSTPNEYYGLGGPNYFLNYNGQNIAPFPAAVSGPGATPGNANGSPARAEGTGNSPFGAFNPNACGNAGVFPEQITYRNITGDYFSGNGYYCVNAYGTVTIGDVSTACEEGVGACFEQGCSGTTSPQVRVYLAVFQPGDPNLPMNDPTISVGGGNAPQGRTAWSRAINLSGPFGQFNAFAPASFGGLSQLTCSGSNNIPASPNSATIYSYPPVPGNYFPTGGNINLLPWQNVTYYHVATLQGIGPGDVYNYSCVIRNLALAPGWKAIPYLYMQGCNLGWSFCIGPVPTPPIVIDNVTITKEGCDGTQIGPLFNGDVYINRYTEKNTFFYFYDWLFKQPDGAFIDYSRYNMVPYPTYWINADEFDVGLGVQSLANLLSPANIITIVTELVAGTLTGIGTAIVDIVTGSVPSINPISSTAQSILTEMYNPSDLHVLDRMKGDWFATFQTGLATSWPIFGVGGNLNNGLNEISFIVKYGYFYMFNSGVRDFYVESEYNTALRDWDDVGERRHYDYKTFTSLSDLFYTEWIKAGNFYRYDNSLSISKNWYTYVNWGNMQQRSYDPILADTCFEYRPDRVIYSLQQQYESVKDNWRLFLANNYKDFLSRVNSIKQINKSGVLILFQSDSPLMFQGTDQLQTDLGTKLTIGDGGLFSQPMQNVVNAERTYEYGSCQNRLSVINTPMGTFWVSQNQGKIFHIQSSLSEVSMGSVKWWLAKYLPYNLTRYFPTFPLTDNPVVGVGCQAVYDNQNNLVYFTKKDYKPKLDAQGNPIVQFSPNPKNQFNLPGFQANINLGDPLYFDSASWTISYDLKTKQWISFHDWHPDLTMPSKNTFMTTKLNGVWIHNKRCDRFANYYGADYPFEVEYMVNTIQTVNTLRSIEYQLEVYKYNQENCYDRFHVLDFNFDTAVVYNTEQCSGTLRLNLSPKNNASSIISYPFYNTGVVANEILYSKEENKYRFNQFSDITRDRGEFDFVLYPDANPSTGPIEVDASSVSPTYPSGAIPGGQQPGSYATQPIWSTGPEGYVKVLNTANLNYVKSSLQRKKFRHYTTSVLLKRRISGDKKMLISLTNNKNLLSPR